jgi:hypothetical protein
MRASTRAMLGCTLSVGCFPLFCLPMRPNPTADVDSEVRDNSIDLNLFVKFVPKKNQITSTKFQINSSFQ